MTSKDNSQNKGSYNLPDDKGMEELKDFSIKIEEIFNRLFCEALNSGNDNLYMQTLLGANFFGMRDEYSHPEFETMALFYNTHKIINQLEDTKSKVRLMLFLYCHVYENNFIPRILYNLISIKTREYNQFPFPLTNKKWEMQPENKIKILKKLDDSLGNAMEEMFISEIRNCFFHSDYTLTDKGFRTSPEKNMISKEIPYSQLLVVLQKMFRFFDVFMQTWMKYKTTIFENGDVVKGSDPINNWQLIVDPKTKQVIGFETTFDSVRGKYLELRGKL